jgi:DNA-directed RNA polymerase specialized sigma24 family protein
MAPDIAAEEHELARLYGWLVMTLPETPRRVFIMIREEEKTYEEVAQSLGISKVRCE